MTEEQKEKLKKILDSSHINFLIGSGASCDYLSTLSNIEKLLSESNMELGLKPKDKTVKQINYSIKHKYFQDCVKGNLRFANPSSKVGDDKMFEETYQNYQKLIMAINTILMRRKTNVINRQVNLFTTNMDLFLDDVLEKNNLNFNDGFSGRMKPIFSTSNYKKSVYQSSSHYDNISEIPTYNLFKLHGSVNWKKESDSDGYKIVYCNTLNGVTNLANKKKSSRLIKFDNKSDYNQIKESSGARGDISELTDFLNAYDELVFVNPTKEKFQLTTIDYVFYEQLRMYSNALEKENSVMFVHGFSFSDEHIREITIRAVKSNPTLILYVFCFNKNEKNRIDGYFKNQNNVIVFNNGESYTFGKQIEEYYEEIAKDFDREFWKPFEPKTVININTKETAKEQTNE